MALPNTNTLRELGELSRELENALSALLDVSNIREMRQTGAVMVINPYFWTPLDPSHQRFVGEARKLHDRWTELGVGAVRTSAPDRIEKFEKAGKVFGQVISQSKSAPGVSIESVRGQVSKALNAQREMLDHLPAAQLPAERLLAPDTNAFIRRLDLEAWKLDGNAWTVVALPQVVRELDGLKMRPGDVGDKAEKVIKRFKEFGRRGDTFEGVTIAGQLTFREVAIDADMAFAPSWLRAEHADDQFLAAALELKWTHLTSTVAVVTGDRNLQNKARFARASYIDLDEL